MAVVTGPGVYLVDPYGLRPPHQHAPLLWGQTIFISHQVKQLLNGRGHLWMSDQRILRYHSDDGKNRPDYIPL